jgi:bacterioferritin-associated ferredoxin
LRQIFDNHDDGRIFASVWNRLKTRFFLLHRANVFNIAGASIITQPAFHDCLSVIICSCNVISDHDVRSVVTADASPRTASEVYGCLGCSVECGRRAHATPHDHTEPGLPEAAT